MKKTNVIIIGTGNLAYHLLKALSIIDSINVAQLVVRTASAVAKKLSKQFNVDLVTIDSIQTDADVYIICVKDEAIIKVAEQLSVLSPKAVLVHTSGSVDVNVLKHAHKNVGVLYPLQTFSLNDITIDWKTIPILIEASNTYTRSVLKKVSTLLSERVVYYSSEQRLQMHLAAVTVNNFTNALYTLANDYLSENVNKKSFFLLLPLIQKTAEKLNYMSPRKAQTGPALRDDKIVMSAHLKLLKNKTDYKTLYKLMSKIIAKNHHA